MLINDVRNKARYEVEDLFRRESEYFSEDDEYREDLEMRPLRRRRVETAINNTKERIRCEICRA
ncbi:MAG: hypothetical protein VB064_11700 [Oscillospiraceae bacterium]|nr:hypothetical protein [Oscillospiraceae bacterium]